MRFSALVILTTLTSSLVSCGGHTPSDKLRPKDATAAGALKEGDGSTVKACAPAPGEPLVIDLRSSDRSDFELAMQDGVAVVSYNCKELKLLKSCNLHGAYTFAAVSRKEDVVQMQSRDEVEANIPITGTKLSAALKSGSTIDLALITVGKRRTRTRGVYLDDLQGDCDGATHIIRGAYVGAFAMGTGTVGQASAVADMFGVGGASGKSGSDRKTTAKDGDLVACRQSAPDSATPPAECAAITRLDLVPLRKRPPSTPSEDVGGDAPPPPPDLSVSSSSSASTKPGKKPHSPTKPSTKKPHLGSHAESAAAAAAPAASAEDEADTTPSCPEGFAWNGVICKKK